MPCPPYPFFHLNVRPVPFFVWNDRRIRFNLLWQGISDKNYRDGSTPKYFHYDTPLAYCSFIKRANAHMGVIQFFFFRNKVIPKREYNINVILALHYRNNVIILKFDINHVTQNDASRNWCHTTFLIASECHKMSQIQHCGHTNILIQYLCQTNIYLQG